MKRLVNINSTSHILVIDALRYSLELERKTYSALRQGTKVMERTKEAGERQSESTALRALSNAWNMLDTVHRIRGLIRQVPGLSQKTPEVQLFLRYTKAVEDFRHLYQHLNSEIPKVTGQTNPIMGVLSWVTKDPNMAMTIFVGTGSEDISAHTVAVDTYEGKFAQNVLFSAGNKDIELQNLHSQCRTISKYLNAWLRTKGYLSDESAGVSAIGFGIQFRSNKAMESDA